MVAGLHLGDDGVDNGSHAGGKDQCAIALLRLAQNLLYAVGAGVGHTGIDVAVLLAGVDRVQGLHVVKGEHGAHVDGQHLGHGDGRGGPLGHGVFACVHQPGIQIFLAHSVSPFLFHSKNAWKNVA